MILSFIRIQNKFHSSFTFFNGKLLFYSFPAKKSKVSSLYKVISLLYFDLSLNNTHEAACTGLSPPLSSSIMFSKTLSSDWMDYLIYLRLFMIFLTWYFLSMYFGVSFNKFCLWHSVISKDYKKSAVHDKQFLLFSFDA